ncbi:MAG TPA: ATP-dependent zinc metalloprotease FtsH [Solirubrobacteraceae bacterium]|nr:ATP-dependent zinc metalloprotease FtsH [Solirubrobacteraceae bacterium]
MAETRRQQPDGSRPPASGASMWGGFLLFLLLLLAVNLLLASAVHTSKPTRVAVPYSPTFLAQVAAGNVSSISAKGDAVEGNLRRSIRYPKASSSPARLFSTELPAFVDNRALLELLRSRGVVINATAPSSGTSLFVTLLSTFGPALLIVLLFVWVMRRTAGVGGGAAAFGRSRAQRVEPSQQLVTFDDVAGIDEAKEELSELVDFLRAPDKYRRLGGRIPRGVLLTGPPGTGKTLLARALAGEAQVPFFSISASEFVELFVGVGASRVRDLFTQAKAAAPAIIFIDELDAIGRSRAGAIGGFGGHDEREQTLNQILTEMDGFDPSVGVIVLSATNRPEVLDAALLRPGRFDRRVALQPPDTAGRRKILDVHTRSVPLADDVDLDRLAATTAGMVGADLANVVNEGALMAARRGHDSVQMGDLHDALEKLVLGTERRILLGAGERRRTAYHEAGHAIVGMLTLGADPVRKVSIIPRGVALGVTLSAPEADRFSYSRDYLRGRIEVALGGRVAEELVFEDVTTGAENDLRQVTDLARNMVGRWGMSDVVGPLVVMGEEGQAPPYPGGEELAPATRQLLDEEVRRLVENAHEHVTRLLSDNRARLDALAQALLDRETLEQDEAYAAAGLSPSASGSRSSPATARGVSPAGSP